MDTQTFPESENFRHSMTFDLRNDVKFSIIRLNPSFEKHMGYLDFIQLDPTTN